MTSEGSDRSKERVLVDTSVFVAQDVGRTTAGTLPPRAAVSVVALGELWLGVLAAPDAATRAARMRTLRLAESLSPLPIDADVAIVWAELRFALRGSGRSMPANDSWIAATAIRHGMLIMTQDADYEDVPGLDVVRV